MRYRLVFICALPWLTFATFASVVVQGVTFAECLQARESEASSDIQVLLGRADEAFRDDEDFNDAQLCEALRLYERVLALDPANKRALNNLSQGYFMLGIEFLQAKEEKRQAFERGRDRGLARLGVPFPANPIFLCAAALPIIQKATEEAGLEDPERVIAGIFWSANNWGKWLDTLPEGERISRGFGDLPCVQGSFARSLELDETYFAGAPRRSMGSLISQLPGGNLAEARAHFERAIEIAPDFLENKADLACGYAVKAGDRALFDRLLDEVLQASIGEKYIFWNRRAQRFAQDLKTRAEELFAKRECKL